MRSAGWQLMLPLCLLVAACGDDTTTATPDKGTVVADAAIGDATGDTSKLDGPRVDGAAKVDGSKLDGTTKLDGSKLDGAAVDGASKLDAPPAADAAAGACSGADRLILENPASKVDDVVGNCALGCILAADKTSCVQTCVVKDLKISQGCALCFGKAADCTFQKCVPACIQPSSAACVTCRDQNCQPAFITCSGMTP